MASIWCAEDRMTAFDNAMAGKAIKPATCNIDIKRHYMLGSLFGIKGRPPSLLTAPPYSRATARLVS